MERKEFIKKITITGVAASIIPSALRAGNKKESTYDLLMQQVGFNHLPNKEEKTMKSIIHRATTRGHADHGWLNTHHTFSFANYYNPERMHFGVLRVLNDDIVQGGGGFPTHPHDNMEIISIPLEGELEHKDSMGNTHVIRKGDIQVMSAGTGIFHSEYNRNEKELTNFLQIWLFPNKKNVSPRYDQLTLDKNKQHNQWQQILSPNEHDEGVWIHQEAWFNMTELEKGKSLSYNTNNENNGAYLFVLEGSITLGETVLEKRDGMGVWDTDELEISAKENSKVLLMEVPMTI